MKIQGPRVIELKRAGRVQGMCSGCRVARTAVHSPSQTCTGDNAVPQTPHSTRSLIPWKERVLAQEVISFPPEMQRGRDALKHVTQIQQIHRRNTDYLSSKYRMWRGGGQRLGSSRTNQTTNCAFTFVSECISTVNLMQKH